MDEEVSDKCWRERSDQREQALFHVKSKHNCELTEREREKRSDDDGGDNSVDKVKC